MKRLIVILLTLGFAWGCEDALDMTPENSATFRNAYETENDMEAAVRLCAQTLRERNGGAYANGYMGCYADSVTSETTRRHINLDPTYVRSGTWSEWYNLIAAANVVIKFSGQIEASQERKDYYLGQGYFYRAYAYFRIVQEFGDCVIVGLDADMEVARPKSPWTEVVDYAIADAREAVRLLPTYDKIKNAQGESPSYKNEPCNGAANALLAHLCAWKAGGKYFAQPTQQNYDENALWEEAEQACTAIIGSETGPATGVYQLVSTPEEVSTKVMKGNSTEGIFEMQYSPFWDEIGTNLSVERYTTLADGWALNAHYWILSHEFYGQGLECVLESTNLIRAETAMEMFPEGDLRRDAYFWKLDSMSTEEVSQGFAYPYFYRDTRAITSGDNIGGFDHFDYNCVLWRLADIYLLRAECRARLNKNTEAIADLNVIRQRANAKLYDASEYNGDLRYAIFKEREKEMLFELHRYYDIIRNGPEYVRREISPGFAAASDQDFIDGCFFQALSEGSFGRNTALRQNTWWNRYL